VGHLVLNGEVGSLTSDAPAAGVCVEAERGLPPVSFALAHGGTLAFLSGLGDAEVRAESGTGTLLLPSTFGAVSLVAPATLAEAEPALDIGIGDEGEATAAFTELLVVSPAGAVRVYLPPGSYDLDLSGDSTVDPGITDDDRSARRISIAATAIYVDVNDEYGSTDAFAACSSSEAPSF
jgi:hypothetical protein